MANPDKNINAIVGRNIRVLREKMELSQEAFAELCELHRTYIGSVERGERNITLDTLARISKLLILRKGNYRETNFGEYILDGAFRIHPPLRKT